VGLIFTKGDLKEVREVVGKYKVWYSSYNNESIVSVSAIHTW
jgi:hypothetical protein